MLYICILPTAHKSLLPSRHDYQCWPLLYLYTHCTDIIVQVMYICPFLCSLGVVVNECMEDPSLWRAHTFQCIILVPECILYIHFYFDCCKYEKTWYKKFEFFCKKLFEIAHEFLSILLLVVTGF